MNISRRDFVSALALGVTGAARDNIAMPMTAKNSTVVAGSADRAPSVKESDWATLDNYLRAWWGENLAHADENVLRTDSGKTLLFLPQPYVRIGEPGTVYPQMFPDDAAYFNMALLLHNRPDLVRCHLLNYLFWVQRYGFAPNANATWATTRSSVHVLPLTLLRYVEKYGDLELLEMGYPAVQHEYRKYWLAPHHLTPTGLSTYRDLGDPKLSAVLASEAESAMDWTPIWGGDVRQCVPLNLNSILVVYARTLARMAKILGRPDAEVRTFQAEADARAEKMRRLCWNEERSTFLEYNYVTKEHIPVYSDGCFWALWAAVATPHQAEGVVRNLARFEKRFGLSVTDKSYPDPHGGEAYKLLGGSGRADGSFAPESPEPYHGGLNPLMWMYPAGWASTQIIGCAGLDGYGYRDHARRLSGRFLATVINQYAITGKLWEKYNLEDGGLVLPNSRYGNIPYYSFTGAATVVLGNYLFRSVSFTEASARFS